MQKEEQKQIGILGSGRFAETLLRLFGKDFAITVYGRNQKALLSLKKKYHIGITSSLHDLTELDTVIFAVPISSFEEVLRSYAPLMIRRQCLMDVLSVKMHPKKVSKEILKGIDADMLFTHPMFGPESSKNGFKDLPIAIDDSHSDPAVSLFWRNYFKGKGLQVISLSAMEHDKIAARSQGLAHFIGRMLEDFGMKSTPIDTLGAKKLLEIEEQTVGDTWELFSDLQHYNPYTKQMRIDLGKSFNKLFGKLLPERVEKGYTTFGIQGAKGSFSEQAILEYIKNKKITNPKIKYLFTSKRVLEELFRGDVDFGLCALHNSLGGVVDETLEAIAEYRCKIVEEVPIKIRHFLMKRKDVSFEKITRIMAHPQVFKQCKNTLQKLYPDIETVSGEGDMVDTAKAAEALSTGALPKNYAILGSKSIAGLYDLEIIKEDLQDAEDNITSFVLLKRA